MNSSLPVRSTKFSGQWQFTVDDGVNGGIQTWGNEALSRGLTALPEAHATYSQSVANAPTGFRVKTNLKGSGNFHVEVIDEEEKPLLKDPDCLPLQLSSKLGSVINLIQ